VEVGLIGVNRHNVGRIAERIVSNELEYRGFRVSDLNKEGTAANADLLAARDGKTWQIQVKGTSGTWFDYGYCTDCLAVNAV
jgi:HJR/Mrr/RecB family endonuclease